MVQTGKTTQVCCEINNYWLDILGVCETRWTGSGKNFLFNDKKHIIYSGRKDKNHAEGVLSVPLPIT